MLKKIAVGLNAIVILLISYMIITKGFPSRTPDVVITLLVYGATITSFLSLTGILNKK